jgi:hypothetical protein
MTIKELRILPPLAIARLGAADRPLDNYDVDVDPNDPLGYRRLRPAETFEIDNRSGEILRSYLPKAVTFMDGSKVMPVAPFLEVWALTTRGQLEPLTLDVLRSHRLSPADVKWNVHLANLKVYRRTGDVNDQVLAKVGPVNDHKSWPLGGKCLNFWPHKLLPLGWVRYLKPTDGFPAVRLRFTPAHGYVYGASKTRPGRNGTPTDQNLKEVLYNANKGGWLGFIESGDATTTNPPFIFANDTVGGNFVSKGYIDDECDGLVSVELKIGPRVLTAYARIAAGPPAYAPDSFPVRSAADELDQAMFGPEARQGGVGMPGVEEILRRAVESVRLMNTTVMNGNTVNGVLNSTNTMASQDTGDTSRYFEPIMSTAIVDNHALITLHQSVLTALRAGSAPWFADLLRNFDEVGDLSSKGRRKMPAMMRGADGRYLALTRRQVDLVRRVARHPILQSEPIQDSPKRKVRSRAIPK